MSRTAILSIVAGWLALIALPVATVADQAQRPNILFIMADDHAAQSLFCYGSYRNKTPNLDRLAEQGVLFTNCFCTNSICGPSRATILTSKCSHLNGFARNSHKFDGSQQTVAKLMQAIGYQTAMIGMINKHYGVRTDRYKLIYFHELDEWDLYDLQEDPRELNSVYGDPAYAAVVQELKRELTRLRKQYKDDDKVAVR